MSRLIRLILPAFLLIVMTNIYGEDKLEIPDEEQVTQARKLVEEVHEAELKSAQTAMARKTLADKLLNEGLASSDPIQQYALFCVARDICLEGRDYAAAFSTMDAIAEHFQTDPVAAKREVLVNAAASAPDADSCKVLSLQFDQAIATAIRHDEIETALELAKLSLSTARKTRNRQLQSTAQDQVKGVEKLGEEFQRIQQFKTDLAASPDDPQANLEVGRFNCFIKDDWQTGLPQLVRGSDAKLRKIAEDELRNPPDALQLGDSWWTVSETLSGHAQETVRRHSVFWYQEALPGLTGLEKSKAAGRLGELEESTEITGELAAPQKFSKVITEDQHPGMAGHKVNTKDNTYTLDPPTPRLISGARLVINAQTSRLNETTNGNILISIDGGEWVPLAQWTTDSCKAAQRYNNYQEIVLKAPAYLVVRQIRLKFEYKTGDFALTIKRVAWVP